MAPVVFYPNPHDPTRQHLYTVVDVCRSEPCAYPTRVYVRNEKTCRIYPVSDFLYVDSPDPDAALAARVREEHEIRYGFSVSCQSVLPDGAEAAALHADVPALRAWIEQDVDVNARNGRGQCLLHVACTGRAHAVLETVRFLVEIPGIDCGLLDRDGFSPAALASKRGLAEVALLLAFCLLTNETKQHSRVSLVVFGCFV